MEVEVQVNEKGVRRYNKELMENFLKMMQNGCTTPNWIFEEKNDSLIFLNSSNSSQKI